jgi:predicted translin family RNA/ssDNA-binding protein
MEVITDEQKAEALTEHFHNMHKTDDTNATKEQTNIKNDVNKLIRTISESDEHYFATYLTNPKELHGIIKKLQKSRSPGDDRISCNKISNN